MAAATRRLDHLFLSEITRRAVGRTRTVIETFNRLVVLAVAVAMVWFGYKNFLLDFGSFRMPSMIPLGTLHRHRAAVGGPDRPVRDRAARQRWRHGFAGPGGRDRRGGAGRVSNGAILVLMGGLFLGLGYMGVPVAFALIAGVLVATVLTPISFPSIIGQLFHGIDSEALLAVPFFLLVGELMTSADVTQRMIVLAQTLVGHMRGGLAQVVTLFSMFFAGISGSSTADVAVLSPHRRARDGPRGLRPRLHRGPHRLGLHHGQPHPARASWRWSTAPPATSRSAGCSWAAWCRAWSSASG